MAERQTSVVLSFLGQKVYTRYASFTLLLNVTTDTNNAINAENEGYEHVTEYIPIAQPNHTTLAKLAAHEPSSVVGDRASYTFCPQLPKSDHLL